MNILLMHFRVGETDGVSLEMDKWKQALEGLGHKVFYLAGSCGQSDATLIEELHYLNPANDKIIRNAYEALADFKTKSVLLNAIESRAKVIADKICKVIDEKKIDIVVPNNIWSLGYHLPAGIGLLQAIERTQTNVICHHHDFHWEREKYSNPTSGAISHLLDNYFPPKHPLIKHCVINRIAQSELKKRRDIDSVVVPNVFDFLGSNWKIDEFNKDLRSQIGLKENDLLALQATRIVSRKGIELAIDLLQEVGKQRKNLESQTLYNQQRFDKESRIVLVLAGMNEEDSYLEKLKAKALNQSVELLLINDCVAHTRSVEDKQKTYSLWDVYSHADLITYPSLLEGWGNQFLEGLVAKVPMVVYRYPVYDLDIADYKFNIIDLGNTHSVDSKGLAQIDNDKLKAAARLTIRYLLDRDFRTKDMQENFLIGEKNFSYQALSILLEDIFKQ